MKKKGTEEKPNVFQQRSRVVQDVVVVVASIYSRLDEVVVAVGMRWM